MIYQSPTQLVAQTTQRALTLVRSVYMMADYQ